MRTQKLSEDFAASAIGYGCMGLSHAYGAPLDEDDAIRVIRAAYDAGYTLFDTAEIYGPQENPNANEEVVGKALKGIRDEVQIVTKFGVRHDREAGITPYPVIADSDPARIRSSVEGSLKRLNTDRIDLYFQHRIDANVEPETVADVMSDLIKEGKVLHWGISEASGEYLRRAHAVCPVTAVENRYSMMSRGVEAMFPTLEELGVGLVAFSPMANGLLTGAYSAASKFDGAVDYRAAMPQFKAGAYEQNQELLDLVNRVAQSHDATPAQVSLAWMIDKKPWIVPIPGSRSIDRLAENAGAVEVGLSADEVSAIDAALDAMQMSDVFGGSKVTPAK